METKMSTSTTSTSKKLTISGDNNNNNNSNGNISSNNNSNSSNSKRKYKIKYEYQHVYKLVAQLGSKICCPEYIYRNLEMDYNNESFMNHINDIVDFMLTPGVFIWNTKDTLPCPEEKCWQK